MPSGRQRRGGELSAQTSLAPPPARRRSAVVAALGFTQILGYGSSFYLLAVLAQPIAAETGWKADWIVAGLSLGMLVGGLVMPNVGSAIDRHGGRFVLAGGSLGFATGLAVIGLAQHFAVYCLGWALVGLGMGAALYEAAFAALGRWYREEARLPITAVTLWGGFASTLCWPLSAYLVAAVGWRGACFAYAALHLFVALPLHALLPKAGAQPAGVTPDAVVAITRAQSRRRGIAYLQIGGILVLTSAIVAILSVHLLPILQERGYSAAAAVAIGALIGPAQVAGRFAELVFGRWLHVLWTTLGAGALLAFGIVVLVWDVRLAALAVIVYGAGAGVSYIVRGTLPLAVFGADGYATVVGRLAFPSLLTQALAPWAAAMVLVAWGSGALLALVLACAIGNLAFIAWMIASRPAT